MRRIVVLLVLVVLAGCSSRAPSLPPTPASTPTEVVLPEGWRWESYRGVEVGVPGTFGVVNGSQRISQWCVAQRNHGPAVGRPGGSTLVACGLGGADGAAGPHPQTLISNTGTIVAFEDATYGDGSANPVLRGGDRTVVRLGDVYVIVQVRQPLRDRIAATVRRADVDANECPRSDPVAGDVARRPDNPVDLATLRGIQSVSACRYRLRWTLEGGPDAAADAAPNLLSSERFVSADAFRLVRQIAKSPRGGGPDRPQNCLPEAAYGDEMLVLRITSASRVSSAYVRYSGCDHHGFDDGVRVRRLTLKPMKTLVSGSNAAGDPSSNVLVELFGLAAKE